MTGYPWSRQWMKPWRPFRCYCGNSKCIYNILNNRKKVWRTPRAPNK